MNLEEISYKPIIKNGEYLFSSSIEFDKPVEIHFKDIFNPTNKTFDISFLASWYNIHRPGYLRRAKLWNRKEEIIIPKQFYTSIKTFSNTESSLPGGEKESLFDSMFHVAIENQSIANYFTEKLVDAFLTETIPVYWGCPNINEYFDLDGMIIFDTIDEMIENVNLLTKEYYMDRKEVILNNKKKAIKFSNFDERIATLIRGVNK